MRARRRREGGGGMRRVQPCCNLQRCNSEHHTARTSHLATSHLHTHRTST
jgi:hypothetical protein